MEKGNCANNSYFKKKGRQRQTTGSFPPCVFLMRKALRRGTHPRGIRAINLWKKQKMWGPPAALGRKKTNAESSDLPELYTNTSAIRTSLPMRCIKSKNRSEGRRPAHRNVKSLQITAFDQPHNVVTYCDYIKRTFDDTHYANQ